MIALLGFTRHLRHTQISLSFATVGPRDEYGIKTSSPGAPSVSSPNPFGQSTNTVTIFHANNEPLQVVFRFRPFLGIVGCPDGTNNLLQTFDIGPSITVHSNLLWRYIYDIILSHQGMSTLQYRYNYTLPSIVVDLVHDLGR